MSEFIDEKSPKKTIKLYSWDDLCDFEQLLLEKWRVANEMRDHNEDALQELRRNYMKMIKEAVNELGKDVPANKANELGF